MPSNKPGSRLIKAAGGVAWRPGPDNEPEILLVHRKKYDDWSLPKGKVEPGEPLPVTAVREVMEEGGARLSLGRRLASVRYSVGGRPKRVHYWVARVLSVDHRAVPNHEVDEITWLPAGQAVEKVSYRRDHGVLAEFAARPQETVPLILLRHAKALPKHGWKRDDDARPLDDSGRSDAKSLADLLACFAPSPRLVSSTAIRCLETLLPLAELTGEPVLPVPSLYMHHTPVHDDQPNSELVAVIREAIASGRPTVLCAHRENIPALRRAALALLAALPPGTLPDDDPNDSDPGDSDPGDSDPGDSDPGDSDPDDTAPGQQPAGQRAASAPGKARSGEGSTAAAPGPAWSASTQAAAPLGPVTELPPDWDDSLPTGSFWVLNIAHLPAEPAPPATSPAAPPATSPAAPPATSPAAPPATSPAEPAPPAEPALAQSRLRRWRRPRPRPTAIPTWRVASSASPAMPAAPAPASPLTAGEAAPRPAGASTNRTVGASTGDPADNAPADPHDAPRPMGILVSADRYDLSD